MGEEEERARGRGKGGARERSSVGGARLREGGGKSNREKGR